MPDSHDTHSEKGSGEQWYLQSEDGGIFGPADTETLHEWAEQGRISPGYQLSADQETWTPVEELPDLKMQWMVELDDGTLYGPINIRALSDLITDGIVSDGTKLIQHATGEEATIKEKMDDILGIVSSTQPSPGPVAAKKKSITLTPVESSPEPAVNTHAIDSLRKQLADETALRQELEAAAVAAPDQQVLETELDDIRRERDALANDLAKVKLAEKKAAQQGKQINWIDAGTGKSTQRTEAIDPAALAEAKTEVTRLATQMRSVESKLRQREAELKTQVSLQAKSAEREQSLRKQIDQTRTSADDIVASLHDARTKAKAAEERATKAEAAITKKERDLEKRIAQLTEQTKAASLELQKSQDQMNQQANDHDALKTAAQKREAALKKQVHNAKKEATEASEQLELARKDLDIERTQRSSAKDEVEKRDADLKTRFKELEAAAVEKDQSLATASAQLKQEQEQSQTTDRDNQQLHAELADKVDKLKKEATASSESLDMAREEIAEQKAHAKALLRDNQRTHANQKRQAEQFSQLLVEESRSVEREIDNERVLFESIRAAFLTKEHESKQRITHLQGLVGATLEKQEQIFDERLAAVAKAKELETELTQERTARQTSQQLDERREQDLLSQIHMLQSENDSYLSKLVNAEQDIDKQNAVINELQTRGLKTDKELAARVDQLQDECLTLTKDLSETQLQFEETRKQRDDSVTSALQRDEELRHQQQLGEKTASDSKLREQDLNNRIDELQTLHATATSRLDQLEWDTKQRESAQINEIDNLAKDKSFLDQQNDAASAEIKDLEVELVAARDDLAGLSTQQISAETQAHERDDAFTAQLLAKTQETAALSDSLAKANEQLENKNTTNVNLEQSAKDKERIQNQRLDQLTQKFTIAETNLQRMNQESQRHKDAAASLNAQIDQQDRDYTERTDRMEKDHLALSEQLEEARLLAEQQNDHLRNNDLEIAELQKLYESSQEDATIREQELEATLLDMQTRYHEKTEAFEQLEKQTGVDRTRASQRSDELERFKQLLQEEQKTRRFKEQAIGQAEKRASDLEQLSTELQERLADNQEQYEQEVQRRQTAEQTLIERDSTIEEISSRIQEREQQGDLERTSAQEAQDHSQHEFDDLTSQHNTLQGEHRTVNMKLDETVQELEQQRIAQEDERTRTQQREEELQLELDQMRKELRTFGEEAEQSATEYEQTKILGEDEEERSRLKTEDLQQQLEQLQQEREATTVRLDQQKKFYDEEREQRRQRELELLQQKKSLQDANAAVRQKDQHIAQQKKLNDDERARWHHKEEILSRRVEQLQREWRAASTKFEQAQRELLQQKKAHHGDQNRGLYAKQEQVRRSIRSNKTTSSLADIEEEQSLPLAEIEHEAERELRTWQNTRRDQPPTADEPPRLPPKTGFQPKPWMRLK